MSLFQSSCLIAMKAPQKMMMMMSHGYRKPDCCINKSVSSVRKNKNININTSREVINGHNNGIGVLKFLHGKNYFITGATGFLGKALIEKLLRAMPDIGKIFVLINARNIDAAMDRLKAEIMESDLFARLKEMHGKSYEAFMLSKLVPIVGNICESYLGMDATRIDHIAKEVDVIINLAANTTFDERYDVAINTNTRGPFRLVSFAKKCKNLCTFIHVSTSYVNGGSEGIIKEKAFYLGESIKREKVMTAGTRSVFKGSISYSMLNIEDEIKLALDSRDALEDDVRGSQKLKELGLERARIYGWRNTYEFTKSMGEMLINNSMRGGEVPLVTVRPSVIQSTYNEPFPGWIEGYRMLDPLILSYGKGRLPGFFVNPEDVIDVIPVDKVVNAIIAAMAKHGSNTNSNPKKQEDEDMKIYHVASSAENPLTLHDLFKFSEEHFISCPMINSEGKRIEIEGMKFFNSMDDFSSYIHTEFDQQSGLMDLRRSTSTAAATKLFGKLERKCQIFADHAINLAKIYEPYMFYGGIFDNGNTQELMEAMSEEEKRSFGFDVGSVNWKDYLMNVHIPGLRKHVMKGRGMNK